MPALTAEQQAGVEHIVSPERARFDVRERRVYSHDTGVLPSLVRPLAGSSLADGVVQPEREEQLVALALWARWEGIPLVPRGKATSGYGGAVPARGGLVLDLTRLLYPTSAPSSTVGGWLAQGGAGIGSHAYGWFRENVVSARVVGGDGVVRVMAGAELAGVADAEGTTGIISEVSLRVRPAAELEQTLVGFPNASDLAEAVRLALDEGLPIWSLSFVNPTMARLKNAGPPKTHHGHPLREGLTLPEDQLLALFVYDAARSPEVLDGLRRIAEQTGARRRPAALARHEWAERFKPMRLKRLGPSLVPAEVVVPLDGLAPTLDDLARTIRAPMAIEGMSVRGREVVLLGFIPHDERSLWWPACCRRCCRG